jgi:copper transport protein
MPAHVRLSVRGGVRLTVVVGLALAMLGLWAVPASAHPTLLSTTPEAGYSVSSAPDRITMVFDEPVTVDARGVRVEDSQGNAVRTSTVEHEQGGRRLVVRVLDHLESGRYVVRWRVTAQDGDLVDADFDFAVAEPTAALRGRESAATAGFPLVALLRWLFFVGMVVVLGGLVGERIARRASPDAVEPRSLVRPAALLGLLAALGLLFQLVIATDRLGRAGYLLGLEAAGFAMIAALGGRVRWWLLAPPMALLVVAEAFRNHLGSQRGPAGALLLAVHLVAVAIWAGSLVHMLRVAYADRGGASLLRRSYLAYSRLALWLVLLVATSGVVAALLLLPNLQAVTGTAYGRTLLVKLGLVVAVVVLAWFGRRRLRGSVSLFGRVTRFEVATLAAVLGASAVLVSLPTPAPATADLGYPPPVSGPAVRLGTLAGQIAVGIAASENRLELRLRVPDVGRELGESEAPKFQVSARVSAPRQAAAVVALRPCGPGCFVGPVSWSAGTWYVDLRVDADGWSGGAAVFPVRWVPVVAPDVLPRIRAVMAAQTAFRVMETVTSDTSRVAPKPQRITTNGREFVASEPYGSPPDPQVVTIRRATAGNVFAFGLPAEGIYVELEVDASYRIIREKLAAPKHLTERTFSYPR